MGDFNSILCEEETNGDLPARIMSITDFQHYILNLGVTDLHFSRPLLTRWDCNIDNSTLRKLDRGLTNETWLEAFDMPMAIFLPRDLPDHCPATVNMGTRPDFFLEPFQVFHHLIDNDGFIPIIIATWSHEVITWYILTTKLRKVKESLKTMNNQGWNIHIRITTARFALLSFQASMPVILTASQFNEDCKL